MRNHIAAFLLLLLSLIIACSSGSDTVEVTRLIQDISEVEVTRVIEVEITIVIEVTRLVEITRIVEKIVTATFTPTPENSPTPSNTPTASITPTASNTPTITPTPSNTPTSTPSPLPTSTPDLAQTATIEAYGILGSPKNNGFFTVGTEILPGKWHSTGAGDSCYWARLDINQDIEDNHFGIAGGTVFIRETDYEVQFEDCGMWEYVENAEHILLDDAAEPKGSGFFTVNVEIAPGRWQSDGSGDSCYWSRLTSSQDIIDNHYGLSGGSVYVNANDYEVNFDDCGTWEYLGP